MAVGSQAAWLELAATTWGGGAAGRPARGATPHRNANEPAQPILPNHIRRHAMTGISEMTLSDDELRVTIKSLSITYDALGNKISRLTGRHKAEAVAEVGIVQSVLNKLTAVQTKRWETQT